MLTTANAAAEWSVTTDITLRETYTDNVFFSPPPARHDFVTQVTPGIQVQGKSRRLTANLNYAPSVLFYARNSQENELANTLNAFGRLEAIERFFFVEAIGVVNQNYISPFEPRPAELTASTPNRIETRTFGLSPYVRGQTRGGVDYDLRNRNTWTTTDNRALAHVHSTQWTGRIASPVRLFGWALEYEDDKVRHEDTNNAPDQESRLYRGRLYYQPDVSWRFSVSAGREENNYAFLQEKRYYDIYGVGVSWRPGPRTAADLEWEHRFFGAAPRARFTHRTRLTAWNVTYLRDVSTSQRQLLGLPPGNTAPLLDAIFAARIPDPDERRVAVEQFVRSTGTPPFLANSLAFYTQRVFLRESLEASVGILGARNSITFTAFGSNYKSLSDETAIVLPDVFFAATELKQHGFGVQADHKITPFTSVGASATRTYSTQEQPPGPDTRDDYFTVTLIQTLSRKTRTFAGLSAIRFSSADASVANRSRNSVFVGLNHRF